MEVEELIAAVKEAVDERIEAEKQTIEEVIAAALAPIEERLDTVESALAIVNGEVGKSKQIDSALVDTAVKSSPHRDAWGRRIRSRA